MNAAACCLLILLGAPVAAGPEPPDLSTLATAGDSADGSQPEPSRTRRRPVKRLIDAISARFRQTIDHTIRSTANAVMPWILLILLLLALLNRR